MSLVNQTLEQISAEERLAGESQCFVGHDFGQKDLRVKLERALKQLGLKPYFADKEVTGEFILTKVCKKILTTRASIVDLTKANPNVYFELGLAVGLNKPVFLVLKSDESVPSLLESFVKISFTNYVALETQIVAEVPGWLQDSNDLNVLLYNHCHFVNTLCPDRQRITPQRRFLVLDEAEGTGAGASRVHTVDQDLRVEVEATMDRFNFAPAFMDDVPTGSSFRLCDHCRALRDSNFVLCHIDRLTSNNVYLLLGLLTGIGIPSLLMIREERDKKGNLLWEVPSMLRGLDAFYYTHAVDIGERLGDEVQGFLNRHAGAPLLDKVLFFPEEFRARPEELFEKKDFAASGLRVVEAATAETKLRGHQQITVEHVLVAFARHESELFDAALGLANVKSDAVRALNEERLRDFLQRAGEEVTTAPAVTRLFKSALERARAEGRAGVEAVDLFLAIAQDEDGLLAELLRQIGVMPETFIAAIEHEFRPSAARKLGSTYYPDRFDETGQRILEHAVEASQNREQNFIAVEHIMEALAARESILFDNIMRGFSLDPHYVKKVIEVGVETVDYQMVDKGVRILPETVELFKRSIERARAQGRKKITTADMFIALAQNDEGPFVRMLVLLGVKLDDVAEGVRTQVRLRESGVEQPRQFRGIDLGVYKDRFTESGGRILDKAAEWSRQDKCIISVAHIINGIATEEADFFATAMRDLSLDPEAVKEVAERSMDVAPKNPREGVRIAPETIDLFKRSMELARSLGRKTISTSDLLLAASRYENPFSAMLKNLGADMEVAAERVEMVVRERAVRAEAQAKEHARLERERVLALRKGVRILLVDRDRTVLESLQQSFEDEGLEVNAVTSVPGALISFSRGQHQMVIAEFGPVGTGGMEILRYVKQRRPDSQVILMSQQLTAEMAVEAGRGGVFQVIGKPPDFALLLKYVDQALNLR